MTIKIDPMFDTMTQTINKIQRDIGITVPNPDPYNRVDFEFDTSRQAYARMLERTGYNPPRTFKTREFEQTWREPPNIRIEIPTPLEELQMHDPPMFRRRPDLEPINYKDPMNHPHTVPDLPEFELPEPPKFELPKLPEPRTFALPKPPEPLKFDFLDPSKKKKEPWEL